MHRVWFLLCTNIVLLLELLHLHCLWHVLRHVLIVNSIHIPILIIILHHILIHTYIAKRICWNTSIIINLILILFITLSRSLDQLIGTAISKLTRMFLLIRLLSLSFMNWRIGIMIISSSLMLSLNQTVLWTRSPFIINICIVIA